MRKVETKYFSIALFFLLCACARENQHKKDKLKESPRTVTTTSLADSSGLTTHNIHPSQLVDFAYTLHGVPYKYASSDPQVGFDCSGFITYVFNHFNIKVPRSSADFENVGQEIPPGSCKPGDLILFTGTDSTVRSIGHMGIIVSNDDSIRFIHSTSGKANGVTVTPLNDYYQGRFVKTIRVFANADENSDQK